MPRHVSVRELSQAERSPWVSAAVLRSIVEEAPADRGLLDDLAVVRGERVDDA